MLFSELKRTFDGPKPYAEPSFEYLDRSARGHAHSIRTVMEGWLGRYPESDRPDLIARFRSPDEVQHRGAAFELYLHELLLRSGYDLTVHPTTPSAKPTRPDFLASHETKGAFYLEATQAIEESEDERAAQARINVVYDTINSLTSRNFFVAVDYDQVPLEPPSGRKLRETLGRWLEALDPDRVADEVDAGGHNALPKLQVQDEKWAITFTAMPRAPEKRNTPAGAVIGALGARGRWVNTWQTLRDCLVRKARRYGELDYPLILAVNVVAFDIDRIDAMQALFGQEQYIFQTDNPTAEPTMERAPNGLWYGPRGWRYSRVAAVVLGYDLTPWSYGVRDLTVYVNPWSEASIAGGLTALSSASLANEKMEWRNGVHPADLLELPDEYLGRKSA